MASGLKNLTTNDDGQKVLWTKVRQVTVKGDDPNAVYLATEYNGENQRLNFFRNRRSACMTSSEPIRLQWGLQRCGISEAKKKDLVDLCNTGLIPSAYRSFFDDLPLGSDSSD